MPIRRESRTLDLNVIGADRKVGQAERAEGIVATYGPASVSMKSNVLTVAFFTFGPYRPDPGMKKTCSAIRDKLSRRYGEERVSTSIE